MKRALCFYIFLGSIFGTSCAYKIIGNFEKTASTIDSIAVIPTVFKLADNSRLFRKIYNDSSICSKLQEESVKAINLGLKRKYDLKIPGNFSVIPDTIVNGVDADFTFINYFLNLKDTFIFSNQFLQGVNASSYPYVLINYMEGSYNIYKETPANEVLYVSAKVLASLLLVRPVEIRKETSQIHLQSVLYDTRNYKVIYHTVRDYRFSVNDNIAFQGFVNSSLRKLQHE